MTKRLIFHGLREGVRRFFAFEADRLVHAAAAAGGAAPAAPGGPVSAGRFGLIGLEELREAMGPRWPALEERVRALAETVIQKHLTAGDVFELQADGTYVVLFARMNQAETDFKCRVIGREITERLLGSDLPRLADVESVSVQVGRDTLASDDPDSALAEAFAAGEAVVSSDPSAPPREPGAARHVVPAFVAPAHGADPDWRAIEAEARAGVARVVEAAHERAVRAERSWRYAPVWDFKSMSLIRFRLAPNGPAAGEIVGFDADMAGLSKALDDLARLTGEGRRLVVIATVRTSSLGVEWRRRQLAQLLAEVGPPVRRLLKLEVVGLDFTLSRPIGRFLESVGELGVECALAAPLRSGDVVPSGTALKTASVEIPAAMPQAEALPLLDAFVRQCERAGLQAAAHGLDSRSLVIGAVAAGARFLSGEAVHAQIHDPGQGLRFEPTDLYRDLLVGPA